MCDSRFISAPYLETLFAELRAQAHPFYAFLTGLPKDDFYLFCAYDYRRKSETYEDSGRYRFSLPEFLAKAGEFDPQDEFCIYFVGMGAQEEEDSPARIELLSCEDATVETLRKLPRSLWPPIAKNACGPTLRSGWTPKPLPGMDSRRKMSPPSAGRQSVATPRPRPVYRPNTTH